MPHITFDIWSIQHKTTIMELYKISKIPFYHSVKNQEKNITIKTQAK